MSKYPTLLNFNRHGARRPVAPTSTQAARDLKAKVRRWASRNLALGDLPDLQAVGAALTEAGPLLAQVSSGGPRLLAAIQSELARRAQEGGGHE